jgi:hypothetical protein
MIIAKHILYRMMPKCIPLLMHPLTCGTRVHTGIFAFGRQFPVPKYVNTLKVVTRTFGRHAVIVTLTSAHSNGIDYS